MLVGVPTDVKSQEYRVAITPVASRRAMSPASNRATGSGSRSHISESALAAHTKRSCRSTAKFCCG